MAAEQALLDPDEKRTCPSERQSGFRARGKKAKMGAFITDVIKSDVSFCYRF